MLHLLLLGSSLLLAGPALAEDLPSAAEPVPSSMPAAALNPPAPAAPECPPAPVVPECPPAPVPPETDADKLRKQQAALASKKIELYRRTVKDTTRSKGMFSLFKSAATPIDSDLLLEMDNFTARFGALPEAAEVLYLKGQVHQRMESYPAAAVDWLLLQVAYPDSPFSAEAGKRLKELGEDQLKKHAALLKELQQKARAQSGGERDQRVAAWLAAAATTLNEPDFAAPLAAECAAFLVSNQTYLNEDVIEHALARQAMLIDHQTAIFHFDKLLTLYPDSPHRPDSLLSIATVQRKGLHEYEAAAKTFNRLFTQYPDAEETRQGYESLAQMYDEDMRAYPDAVKTYDAIVTKYKDGPIVLRALNTMALIHQNRMNQPLKAVDNYLKLAEIFKGQDGLDALNKAAKIAQFTARDWDKAILVNERIIAFIPGGDDAVKALFSNAEISEDKLKDKARAKVLYEKVITEFAEHPLAKDAQKRIAAMEKK